MKLYAPSDDALPLTPNPPASPCAGRVALRHDRHGTSRVSACEVHPGDRLADGRMVVARARALDGTLDFRMHNGDRENFHPFKRVAVG